MRLSLLTGVLAAAALWLWVSLGGHHRLAHYGGIPHPPVPLGSHQDPIVVTFPRAAVAQRGSERLLWALSPPHANVFAPSVASNAVYTGYLQSHGYDPAKVDSHLLAVDPQSGRAREIPLHLNHYQHDADRVSPGPWASGNRVLVEITRPDPRPWPPDEKVVLSALESATGRQVWQYSGPWLDTVAIERPAGRWAVFGSEQTLAVRCVELTNGKSLGVTPSDGGTRGYDIDRKMLFVYTTTDALPINPSPHIRWVKAFRLPDLQHAWTRRNIGAPMLADRDQLFARHTTHGFWCLDEGGHVLWTQPHVDLPNEFGSYAAPVAAAGDRVFVSGVRGDLYALSRSNGRILWRSKPAGTLAAGANGMLYVRNQRGLCAVGARDGKPLWHIARIGKYSLADSALDRRRGIHLAGSIILLDTEDWLLGLKPTGS